MTPSAAPPSAAPPALAPATRDEFLAAIRTADLFAPAQLAKAEASVPGSVRSAADAAQALVAAGHLTRFQAERLMAGRTDGFLLGPYVILEQIGRGAMGRVYKARHRTMNRAVAVKVLAAELTQTPAARAAFQREVRSAAKLNHQNVVLAYDANEMDDRFYLVHEFVDGPNFETLVRERGPVPVADACDMVRQAALGLAHAHSHGILHRNLKPANLLVTRATRRSTETVVKIADFGIRRAIAGAGGLVGDPDFIAPELAHRPAAADGRADLYSLGAVLFFLLAGRPLFPGGSAEDKIRHHTWTEPPRIDRLRADVHPAVAALVHQLLSKHPEGRPGSAEEVAERLAGGYGAAAAGGAISFELPPPAAGQYSFATGQLSGCQAVPMATAEPSGGYVSPTSGACPVAMSAAETSPWEQITDESPAANSPLAGLRSRTRSAFPTLGMGGLMACMLVGLVAAVGFLVKVVK